MLTHFLKIIGIIFMPILVHFYWKKFKYNRYLKNIPGPLAFPGIGATHIIINQLDNIIARKSPKIDVVKFMLQIRNLSNNEGILHYWHGHELYFIVSKPEYLEAILRKPMRRGEIPFKFLKSSFNDGLVSLEDLNEWRRHRKILQPTFSQEVLNSFVEIFNENAEVLEAIIENCVNQNTELKMSKIMTQHMLSQICETAMGIKMNLQKNLNQEFSQHFDSISRILFLRSLLLPLQYEFIFKLTGLCNELSKACQFIQQFCINVLKEKKKEVLKKNRSEAKVDDKVRKVFLDYLLEFNVFNEEDVLAEVLVFIVTATGTTSSAICFILEILGIYPDVQDRVYQEVLNTVGKWAIKDTDLKNLKYTEMVIKECLRLFPVVAYTKRELDENLHLDDGKVLPKGSNVILFFLETHRNPKYWDDPMTFNPNRFLPEEISKKAPCSFSPFSHGPRNCIGWNYGIMAMKTTIATLVRRFVIKSGYKNIDDIKLTAGVDLKPFDGHKITFQKRK